MRLGAVRLFVCLAAMAAGLTAVSRIAPARTVVVATQLDDGATPGCPSAATFEAIVAARIGYEPFRADAPDRVIVRIESAGRALEGRIEWRDATDESIGDQAFPLAPASATSSSARWGSLSPSRFN